jgi:hypothetical protein
MKQRNKKGKLTVSMGEIEQMAHKDNVCGVDVPLFYCTPMVEER